MEKINQKFKIPFVKMHGLGNDFLIIDCRKNNYQFSRNQIKLLGDRNLGIGFDQFVLMYKSEKNNAHLFKVSGIRMVLLLRLVEMQLVVLQI